jgi:hypothetical protein
VTTTAGYRTRWRSRSRIELNRICFWIFTVLLFLLPLERIAGPMSTVPADAALLTLIASFWLIAWARRRPVVFPLLLPMWLIFIASTLATLFSTQPITNIVAMVQELYIYLWFVSAVNLLTWLGEEDMHRLNKIWGIVACVESLLTLMGMFRIGPRFLFKVDAPQHQFEFEGPGRALGTFRNANAAGGYLMTALFVLMATPWPHHPLLRLATGGWLFLGIYATGSNASLGGALVGLAFCLLYRVVTRGDRRAVRLWITLGTLMAAAGVAMPVVGFSLSSALRPSAGRSLLFTTVGRLGGSIAKRVIIWRSGWDIFSHNMLGVGPNGASDIAGFSLHNDYMAFLAERGVLGLMGLLLLVALTMACVVASVRLARGDRVRQLQAIALGGGFVANFVDAMAHEVTHSRPLWLLMATIFAHHYVLRQRAGQGISIESNISIAS